MSRSVAKIKIKSKKDEVIVITPNSSFYFEKSGKKRWKSVVKCNCGKEYEINNNYLLREKNIKCQLCKYNEDCIIKIGSVFDKLKVIGYENKSDKRGKKKCVCLCECGKTINIRPESLISNKKNNCGCTSRSGYCVGKLYKVVYNQIKRNALSRKIAFKTDMKYLWSLYEKQNGKCALTGIDIEFGKRAIDNRTASIDRIDSKLGYIEGNLQWIHKDINRMKWNLPQKEFIKFCKLVCKYEEENN